jgi:hypothetical protein
LTGENDRPVGDCCEENPGEYRNEGESLLKGRKLAGQAVDFTERREQSRARAGYHADEEIYFTFN